MFWPLVIGLTTFFVFSPALQNQFTWDDARNLLENTSFRGLGLPQLKWIWIDSYKMGNYEPLNWLLYAFLYEIGQLDPKVFHFALLCLHAVAAILFYFVALRLFRLTGIEKNRTARSVEGRPNPIIQHQPLTTVAVLSAFLFALHPLRAEVVGWSAGQHYILATIFLLLSIYSYLGAYLPETGKGSLRWSAVFFLLSLLSFPIAIPLPAVLLVLDAYPLRRLTLAGETLGGCLYRHWREKRIFFGMAVASLAVIFASRSEANAIISLDQHSLAERLLQTIYGLGFYLSKTIVPLSLSPHYELPFDSSDLTNKALAMGIIFAAVFAAAIRMRRRFPVLLTSFVLYILLLAPVLGFTQSGNQLVADRYSYVSCLGWPLAIGSAYLLAWMKSRNGQLRKTVSETILVAIIIFIAWLAIKAREQVKVWRDEETLWSHVLRRAPTAIAHNNMGIIRLKEGNIEVALHHFEEALRINPGLAEGYNSYGNALFKLNRLGEARINYERAIQLRSNFAEAYNNLGIVLTRLGNPAGAIQYLREAIRLRPDYAEAHYNWGIAAHFQGETHESEEHFSMAIRIEPRLSQHYAAFKARR